MARLPRLTVPGCPHHVIQRGTDRALLFADETDYAFMHQSLIEQAAAHGVAVHAYVLMPDHFHLLLTPDREEALGRLMQGIGRSYVRHRNRRAGRSGTLWEGRYRSAPLQAEGFLLPAMAYLDLNPVRSGLVEEAADWAWSSHRHYIGRQADRLVTPHPAHWELGNTPFAREHAYAQRTAAGLPQALQQRLADSALHGWALGDEAFLSAMQQRTGRRVVRSRPGRPRRSG